MTNGDGADEVVAYNSIRARSMVIFV